MLEKLSFRTDYKTKRDMNSAIALGIGTSFVLLILSFAFFRINALSYLLGLGAIIYQIYSLYMIKQAFRSKEMKPFRLALVFAVVLLIITLFVLLLKFRTSAVVDNWFQILLGFAVIVSPLIFWDAIMGKIKKKLLLAFLLLILLNSASGQNSTIEDKLDTLESGIGFFRSILGFFSDITSSFRGISEWLQNTLGFSSAVSTVFNIVLVLFAIYLITKTMKSLIKWAMIILLVWILLQATGIL